MALEVEGVVNRTVHAEKALGGSSRLEPLQLAPASSDCLMRILRPIVLSKPLLMPSSSAAERSTRSQLPASRYRTLLPWSPEITLSGLSRTTTRIAPGRSGTGKSALEKKKSGSTMKLKALHILQHRADGGADRRAHDCDQRHEQERERQQQRLRRPETGGETDEKDDART